MREKALQVQPLAWLRLSLATLCISASPRARILAWGKVTLALGIILPGLDNFTQGVDIHNDIDIADPLVLGNSITTNDT
tara:strand:- start:306 stop:542 length:237 start_codon:yes stop_codon:yes gene_type:complete